MHLFLTLGLRLKEAWDLHQFQRAAEDELVWARDAEALLSTEDIGRDLQGVRFLLKKHQVTATHLQVYALPSPVKTVILAGSFD